MPRGAVLLEGDTCYVPGLTNFGFVDGLSIDTGPEESAYEGVAIDTLAITHGHADHFACGACMRGRGTSVVAARDDAALIENPDINIRGMFSWAKPSDLLVTKLFQGTPCGVDGLLELWDDPRAEAVHLPGHTLGHTGILTRDGVLFSGDALYREVLWQRHPLPYAIDPDMVAASLDRIASLDFSWLVPGHGEPAPREQALRDIAFHKQQIADIEARLVELLDSPHSTEEAIAAVSAERGLSDSPAGYWLAVTTVKGYLGDLLGRGVIEFYVKNHAGYWHSL